MNLLVGLSPATASTNHAVTNAMTDLSMALLRWTVHVARFPQRGEGGAVINRGQRAMGSFPEFPAIPTSSYLNVPVGEARL